MIQFFTLDNINELVLKAHSYISKIGIKIIDDKTCTGSSILEGHFYRFINLLDVIESRKDFDTTEDKFQRLVYKLYGYVNNECVYYNSLYIELGTNTNYVPITINSTFLQLLDTPDSYVGQSGKLVFVNNLESGLEFGNSTDVFPGAINGLKLDSITGKVKLGGTLTEPTIINTLGTQFFAVANAGAGEGGSIQIFPNGASLAVKAVSGALNKLVFNGTIGDGTDNTIILSDDIASKGFVYGADYSALGILDDRWIPDYAAVKSLDNNNVKLTGNQNISGSKTFLGGLRSTGVVTFTGNSTLFDFQNTVINLKGFAINLYDNTGEVLFSTGNGNDAPSTYAKFLQVNTAPISSTDVVRLQDINHRAIENIINETTYNLGSNPGNTKLILCAADSLTAGAGIPFSTFRTYFYNVLRSIYGDGGVGYVAFDVESASDSNVSFGQGLMTSIDINDGIYGQYSLDGKGLYTTSGSGTGTTFINFKPVNGWTNARIFYLKQSGGGTFRYGTSSMSPASMPVVNTSNSTNDIGFIDITYDNTVPGQNVQLNWISGIVAVFGVYFTFGTKGVTFGNLAKGGRLLHDVAVQDSAIRQKWFSILTPSHYLLNGGMNDRLTISAAQHFSDLTTIATDIKTSSPNTQIAIIQSLEPSDASTTNFLSYTAQKKLVANNLNLTYFNLQDVVGGDYTTVNSRGLYYDSVHPNDLANRTIAMYYLKQLGFPQNSTPAILNSYNSTSSSTIRKQELSIVNLSNKPAGTPVVLYTLGFINGNPQIHIELKMRADRNTTSFKIAKDFYCGCDNSTGITNSASTVIGQIVNPIYINTNAGDITISAAIVSGKLVISCTPVTNSFNIYCEGTIRASLTTTNGPLAYEN